jgi:hypothetical protein
VTIRRITIVLTGVAAASSGAYMIIYLFRWQWNRALIAAIFFVAAEVALVAQLLLDRLRHLERTIETAPQPGWMTSGPHQGELAAVRDRLRATSPSPARHFAWLRDSATQHNVFLPVLLGAGALASAVAWFIETIARRVAQPVAERPAVAGLARLTFPTHGLLGDQDPPPPPPRRGRRWLVVFGALVVVVAMGATIDVVADATQTRPDELSEGIVTVVDVRLVGARALSDIEPHAEDLYWICASDTFPGRLPEPLVVPLTDNTVRYLIHAHLGEHGAVRFRGCVDDTVLEEVQAKVIRFEELAIDP